MANQTRVVLDSSDRPKAEEILETTGIKTFSQLFSILIVNYGDHLVSALKTVPTAPPPPVTIPQQKPNIQPTQSAQPKQFKPLAGL